MKVADIEHAVHAGGDVTGPSWAIQSAMHGLAVTLYDIDDEQLKRSEAQMHKSLDALEQFNAIIPERRGEIVAAIHLTISMEEAVTDARFIQESSLERLEIKQSILTQVKVCTVADTPYASSTFGLLISDIAAKATRPGHCVGAHPYNPPHLIPLVELTSGGRTDLILPRPAYDSYQSIGKEAVLLRREYSGFIANQLQLTFYRGVQDLVTWGVCSAEDVDKVLVYDPDLCWAIFGHNMIMRLDNPDGLAGMVNMLDNSDGRWLADVVPWTHQPDNWAKVAQPGMDKEMKRFPDYIGRTNEVCMAYRDQMLIELLRLHEKL